MKHTSLEFERDLKNLKEKLLLMGGTVESMLAEAADALIQNDADLARQVMRRDVEVDALEKEVDQAALQILALRQPAASDLRFVTSAFKTCTDLERMGDMTVNICERVIELSRLSPLKPYEVLPRMVELTRQMIGSALDAFVNQSTELAARVLKSDLEVDRLTSVVYLELVEIMKRSPDAVERGMKLFFIAKHLERMSDHATNIAEQVVFTVKGLDIRHQNVPGPTPLSY